MSHSSHGPDIELALLLAQIATLDDAQLRWVISAIGARLEATAPPQPNPARLHVDSGSPWEPQVGYSRAVRVGNHVYVAGTTATDPDGQLVGPGDAYAQAHFILSKIAWALEQAGAGLQHVVRTRMFVTDASLWQQVGRAHAEYFGVIRPAATLVEVSALIGPEYLVEIEAEALIT